MGVGHCLTPIFFIHPLMIAVYRASVFASAGQVSATPFYEGRIAVRAVDDVLDCCLSFPETRCGSPSLSRETATALPICTGRHAYRSFSHDELRLA